MNKYTFIAEPFNKEIEAVAATEKEAHKLAWESLIESQRDNCECLDCVDEVPA